MVVPELTSPQADGREEGRPRPCATANPAPRWTNEGDYEGTVKILIVDDDPQLVEAVTLGFNLHWREIELLRAEDGRTALDMAAREHPDLVLLDVLLPVMDGYETLRRLREFSDVPVIMLTALDGIVDKLRGLELGADDYVTKPFDYLELMARTKAILRRLDMPPPASRAPSFRCEDLTVDFATQQVQVGGKPVALTAIEYRLLYHLVRNAGRVLPYRTLLTRVWGEEHVTELSYLRVYIWRLRKKLEADPKQPRHILTENGVGYRFR